MDEKELCSKFQAIVDSDVCAFYQFMVDSGFDLWLVESILPVNKPHSCSIQLSTMQNVVLNKRVRHLVEKEFCNGKVIANNLDPERFRLLSQIDDRMPVQVFSLEEKEPETEKPAEKPAPKEAEKPSESPKKEEEKKAEDSGEEEKKAEEDAKEEETKELEEPAKKKELTWLQILQSTHPVHCFDDVITAGNYPDVCQALTQAQIRYVWAMIRVFNKYYEKTIKFVNQQEPLSVVPESSQPLTVNAYLSKVKDLPFCTPGSAKAELRTLILDRTAISSVILPPKLKLERISEQQDG